MEDQLVSQCKPSKHHRDVTRARIQKKPGNVQTKVKLNVTETKRNEYKYILCRAGDLVVVGDCWKGR